MSARILVLAVAALGAGLFALHSLTAAPSRGGAVESWLQPSVVTPTPAPAIPVVSPLPGAASANPLPGLMDGLNRDTAHYATGEMSVLAQLENAIATQVRRLLDGLLHH